MTESFVIVVVCLITLSIFLHFQSKISILYHARKESEPVYLLLKALLSIITISLFYSIKDLLAFR